MSFDGTPRIAHTDAMDDELPPPDDIPAEEWATWPLAARVLVTRLLARVQVLEQRLNQTSQNSSKPPSSDPPSAPPRPPKVPRGRKAGGQPGHAGHTRERREPDAIVPLHPSACPSCHTPLNPTLPDVSAPRVTQVWELPAIRPQITDYVQHTVCCPTCATIVTAPAAPEAGTGYGPRLTALIGHLHGTYHLSYRAVADLLADVADVPIGLGSVVTSAERVSAALVPIDTAIHAAIQTAPVVNVDETSWRCAHKRAWFTQRVPGRHHDPREQFPPHDEPRSGWAGRAASRRLRRGGRLRPLECLQPLSG